MKILTSDQIRQADAYTIKHEPITSLALMERAALQCTRWFLKRFSNDEVFTIVCGNGNNGGDGLAIARQLADQGRKVQCVILKLSKKGSPDYEANKIAIEKVGISTLELKEAADMVKIIKADVLVDAIFGTGLSRPIVGLAKEIIEECNKHNWTRVALDMPSGLYADRPNEVDSTVFKADYTLSFELPKLAFFLPENADFVGEWHLLSIGLSSEFVGNQLSDYESITRTALQFFIKRRAKFSHKGNYGHATLVCGSFGKMGTAVLASKACLRSGVGLLTVIIPTAGYTILQQSLPEAMVECYGDKELEGEIMLDENIVGIGPGIGKSFVTKETLFHILQNAKNKMVLDADALNILSDNKNWLVYIPDGSILTPHPKEFKRLVGNWENDYQKLELLKNLAQKTNCVIVLKGAYTVISTPEGKVYFNTTGNAGMATGGSGDVLTGIITALLAQGYTSLQAAQLGVYLHGLAGDLAAKKYGEEAMIASDIVEYLGEAFLITQEK